MEYVLKIATIVVYCIVMAFMLLTLGPIVVLCEGWKGAINAWNGAQAAVNHATDGEYTGLFSMIKYIWNA